jgi:rod shape-determining protein MreB
MNSAVQRYFYEEFKLLIGENMAERVKINLGTACPQPEQLVADVAGKDMVSGGPRVIRVSDGHIREALADTVNAVITAVCKALEKTPPELSADIMESGILMAGGGSLLKGLDELVHQHTRLKVRVDTDALTTVVRGTGKTLDDRKFYRRVYIN